MTEERRAMIKEDATKKMIQWLHSQRFSDSERLKAAKKAGDDDGIVWYERDIELLDIFIAEASR